MPLDILTDTDLDYFFTADVGANDNIATDVDLDYFFTDVVNTDDNIAIDDEFADFLDGFSDPVVDDSNLAPITDCAAFIEAQPVFGEFAPPRSYRFAILKPDRNDRDVLECNENFHADDPKFIVHNELDHSFLVFESHTDFARWFAVSDIRTLHEHIRGEQPQKLKFDIDIAAADLGATGQARKAEAVFDAVMEAIDLTFMKLYGHDPNPSISVSDSTDATKFSRHIVIGGFSVANHREARAFTNHVKSELPDDIERFLDGSVNSAKQNFRLPGCHKVGSTRVKRCIRGTPESMIITNIAGTTPLPQRDIVIDRSYAPTSADEALIIAMAAEHIADHEFRNRKNSAFYFNRLRSSHCACCDVIHDKDNTLFITVNHGHVYVRCIRPKSKSIHIGDIKADAAAPFIGPRRKYVPGGKIPARFEVERYNEQYLREFKFSDALLVKANMGTGKTKQLLEMIRNLPPAMGVVLISFRRSFTTEIKRKLGADFVNYRSITGEIDAPRVIIQVESLHRLKLPIVDGKLMPFLLVLDECESVIGQIENGQMVAAGTLGKCWEHFEWLAKYATKMICMDAFADFRTYDLLSTRKHVIMHHNSWAPALGPRDMYYPSREVWLDAVYKAAATAHEEPFVIVATSKKQADAIAAKICRDHKDINLRIYTADSTPLDREDFEDVNVSWANVDILMYTSTISAGCSFELPRFTRMFAYFDTMSVDYKTAIQMMGRIRNISSREYHIFIKWHPSGLPTTVRGVERAIATQDYLCGIRTNPLAMRRQISAIGEYEYPHKDLYFHLHAGNLVHHAQSRNCFEFYFRAHREYMGAKASTIISAIDNAVVLQIQLVNKADIQAATASQNELIATAPELTDKSADAIAASDIATAEDKAALKAHRMIKFFELEREDLTARWIQAYDTPAFSNQWRCLRMLRADTNIADVFRNARLMRNRLGVAVEDMQERKDLMRGMFAVDVLDEMLVFANDAANTTDYCARNYHFTPHVAISRETAARQLPAVVDMLREHQPAISSAFGIRGPVIMSDRLTIKKQMCMVNSIIKSAFGLEFKGIGGSKHGYAAYVMCAPHDFHWADGRYACNVFPRADAPADHALDDL